MKKISAIQERVREYHKAGLPKRQAYERIVEDMRTWIESPEGKDALFETPHRTRSTEELLLLIDSDLLRWVDNVYDVN